MTQTASTVVRKEIVVEAPVERAFAVFTKRIGDFKPPEHNLLRVPIAATVFEPRVGGHIIDGGEDGSECRWASVLAYDPPHRVVFSWNIGPSWRIEADPANRSEVEVTFTPHGSSRIRRLSFAPADPALREGQVVEPPGECRWPVRTGSLAAVSRPMRGGRRARNAVAWVGG
jgi:uncharacterized protein YndB with AHSA1/START domain